MIPGRITVTGIIDITHGEQGGTMTRRGPYATRNRDRIYHYLIDYYAEHGVAPSVREIMTGADVSSTSVVTYNLRVLVDTGLLRRVNNDRAARSVIPVYGEKIA